MMKIIVISLMNKHEDLSHQSIARKEKLHTSIYNMHYITKMCMSAKVPT